ncbi:glutaminyl-peptide cyclotransferase [Corynebacterium macginleyi]|uniref:glutaminyl-peptide cyclotransferase n=1 Tax=Corynebacterium macginleyi TaxID=38290 RepID=UPI00190E5249|nr:glutaminyl-peptide cyclotransferase [Corynebacterium macginleyi]MBK4163921.1 glutaminyl-peptide cyclotransferase [Corynebacterium macginleyi]
MMTRQQWYIWCMSFLRRATLIAVPCCALTACSSNTPNSPDSSTPEHLSVEVLETAPLPENSFTQGLEEDGKGNLLLGTGKWGESRLIRFSPASGEVLQERALDDSFFGEGITRYNDSIWQLTWKRGQALRYDNDFQHTGTATYAGEGWGLCAHQDELVMSDGTSTLRHMDPETFAQRSTTEVTLEGLPVDNLNELECVDGDVYANVWQSNDIYRIDPYSGEVTAVISTDAIDKSKYTDPDDVLNGIAHIEGTDEFWLTGKRWNELYRVRVK